MPSIKEPESAHPFKATTRGRVSPIMLTAGIAAVLAVPQEPVLAAPVTDLNETQAAMGLTATLACVALNNLALSGDPTQGDLSRPSDNQLAALDADQTDLLRRCADAVEAAGIGVQDGTQTAQTHADSKIALSHLAPDEIAAQGTTSVRAVNTQQSNIGARIGALQSGFRGFGVNRISMNSNGYGRDNNPQYAGGAAGDEGGNSRLGAFINGSLSKGEKDPTGRVDGFDFDRNGLTIGADYFVSDTAFVGAALGVGSNEVDIDNNGGGLESDTLSLSVYGSMFKQNNFYLNGFLDYTKSDHDSTRNLNYTLNETEGGCCTNNLTGNTVTVDQSAVGSTDGDQITLAVGGGYEMRSEEWTYGPTFEVTYSKLELDAFTERMTDPTGIGRGVALTFDEQSIHSLKSDIGFFINRAFSRDWGILSAQARVNWYHEFKDNTQYVVARYVHDPIGTPLYLKTDEIDSNFFGLSLDLSAAMAGGKSFFVSYGTLLGLEDISYHQLTAGFRMEF